MINSPEHLVPNDKTEFEETMDIIGLLQSVCMVGVAIYVISWACRSFEGASDHLGKNVYKMAPGIRGATLEAIASSLPEMFTTAILLFAYRDVDGFSAGIATCAGSAIFNAAVIPGVCILAVTMKGGRGTPEGNVTFLRKTIIRDGFFFILAEVVLIYFLGSSELTWWMGAVLIGVYVLYFGVLLRGFGTVAGAATGAEEANRDAESAEKTGLVRLLLTFDFNGLIFKGRDFSANSAWVVLVCATMAIAGACFLLSDAVILSATALGVPAYFTGIILGAAATSVPDTLISWADAMKGDYDDAISNSLGSNIFDICVALGLPLLAYGLIYGDVTLSANSESGSANVQELRIALISITVVILAIFFAGVTRKREDGAVMLQAGQDKGWLLLSLYLFWTLYIVGRAMEWAWLEGLVG